MRRIGPEELEQHFAGDVHFALRDAAKRKVDPTPTVVARLMLRFRGEVRVVEPDRRFHMEPGKWGPDDPDPCP